jgi:hypothetical protein
VLAAGLSVAGVAALAGAAAGVATVDAASGAGAGLTGAWVVFSVRASQPPSNTADRTNRRRSDIDVNS